MNYCLAPDFGKVSRLGYARNRRGNTVGRGGGIGDHRSRSCVICYGDIYKAPGLAGPLRFKMFAHMSSIAM